MAFKIICVLATLAVANAGFIDAPGHSAYTGDVYSHHDDHHEYAPVAKIAYTAPSVSHVYNTVKEVTHTPVHHYTAPIQQTVQYAPVHKAVEYTPSHKTVHYATPSHTLAIPVKKTVAYAPIAKTISYAPAAVYEPTYQHTHESVERSHEGTLSHYGKTVSTPHSHVQKYDTRVTNEHYKLAAVPAVQYKVAPVAQDVHHYTHSTPVVPDVHQYTHSASVQPAPVQHHYSHSAPVQHHYSHSTPVEQQQHYIQSAPVQHHYSHAAPTHQYAHTAPVFAHNKAVSYSPAEAVSHTSFHSNDAQYSW